MKSHNKWSQFNRTYFHPFMDEVLFGKRWIYHKGGIAYQANGKEASFSDPSHWSFLGQLESSYLIGGYSEKTHKNGFDGLGFVLSENCEYAVISIENCFDPVAKLFEPWAKEIVDRFVRGGRNHVEYHFGNTGVNIIAKARIPDGVERRKGKMEVYDRNRYLAITGALYQPMGSRIHDEQEKFDWLLAKFFGLSDK